MKIGDVITDAKCPKDGIVSATVADEKNDNYILKCSICNLFFLLQILKNCPKCTTPMNSIHITVSSEMPHNVEYRKRAVFKVNSNHPNSQKARKCMVCGHIEFV